MTQFTQREFLFLDDLLHAENLAAAKCRSAASCASDPQIRQLFEQLGHTHQQHFSSLLRYLNSERASRPLQGSDAWQSGSSHYTPEANWQQNQSSGYQNAGTGGSWQQSTGAGNTWQQNASSTPSWQQSGNSNTWQQNAQFQPQNATQPVSGRSGTLTQ